MSDGDGTSGADGLGDLCVCSIGSSANQDRQGSLREFCMMISTCKKWALLVVGDVCARRGFSLSQMTYAHQFPAVGLCLNGLLPRASQQCQCPEAHTGGHQGADKETWFRGHMCAFLDGSPDVHGNNQREQNSGDGDVSAHGLQLPGWGSEKSVALRLTTGTCVLLRASQTMQLDQWLTAWCQYAQQNPVVPSFQQRTVVGKRDRAQPLPIRIKHV